MLQFSSGEDGSKKLKINKIEEGKEEGKRKNKFSTIAGVKEIISRRVYKRRFKIRK